MEKEQKIYKMELGESITLKNEQIVFRVPGGWIFMYLGGVQNGVIPSSVFVPFNREFEVKA